MNYRRQTALLLALLASVSGCSKSDDRKWAWGYDLDIKERHWNEGNIGKIQFRLGSACIHTGANLHRDDAHQVVFDGFVTVKIVMDDNTTRSYTRDLGNQWHVGETKSIEVGQVDWQKLQKIEMHGALKPPGDGQYATQVFRGQFTMTWAPKAHSDVPPNIY